MNKINWLLARVPDVAENGATLSASSYAPGDAWLPAVVPGTVLTSYEAAGRIDDPYYSDNILKLDQSYYNVDYWYRGVTDGPVDASDGRLMLTFCGVDNIFNILVFHC